MFQKERSRTSSKLLDTHTNMRSRQVHTRNGRILVSVGVTTPGGRGGSAPLTEGTGGRCFVVCVCFQQPACLAGCSLRSRCVSTIERHFPPNIRSQHVLKRQAASTSGPLWVQGARLLTFRRIRRAVSTISTACQVETRHYPSAISSVH